MNRGCKPHFYAIRREACETVRAVAGVKGPGGQSRVNGIKVEEIPINRLCGEAQADEVDWCIGGIRDGDVER
nr:hypothetical protein [Paracoccus marcusii]